MVRVLLFMIPSVGPGRPGAASSAIAGTGLELSCQGVHYPQITADYCQAHSHVRVPNPRKKNKSKPNPQVSKDTIVFEPGLQPP